MAKPCPSNFLYPRYSPQPSTVPPRPPLPWPPYATPPPSTSGPPPYWPPSLHCYTTASTASDCPHRRGFLLLHCTASSDPASSGPPPILLLPSQNILYIFYSVIRMVLMIRPSRINFPTNFASCPMWLTLPTPSSQTATTSTMPGCSPIIRHLPYRLSSR